MLDIYGRDIYLYLSKALQPLCVLSSKKFLQPLGLRNLLSKRINTREKISLAKFDGDKYHIRTAKTIKEDKELLKSGFEYVTERDGVKIYRKRK